MGKIIKKALRILMWVFLSFAVLLAVFFFLIQGGGVQTYMAQKVATYLSRELETDVYIEKLKIAFPLYIDIKNLGIDDRRGAPILRTQSLKFNLSSLSPRSKELNIGKILLEDLEVNLITYENDSVMNFQFIIDYFAGEESDTAVSEPWSFKVFNASIINASFALRDLNIAPKPFGIDYNHLQLRNIHLSLSNLTYQNDTLFTQLHHLSTYEGSGFILNRLGADISLTPQGIFAENLILQTPQSDLLLDLAFLFNNFSAFNYFIDRVYMQADIFPSELDISDIAYFAPDIQGMDSKFFLEGRVRGEVNNLHLQNMAINYGAYTGFKGNISLDGLPNVKETFIHINARKLTTHHRDLKTLKLPSKNGPTYLEFPDEVTELGLIRVKARFTGFYNDFVSDGTFITNLGSLSTDIAFKYDFETRKIVYAGELTTKRFNLGQFLGEEDLLGLLNMTATIDGSGHFPSSFDARFSALIDSVEFKGNKLNSLVIDGELLEKQFNGTLTLRDELINLDFHGLFNFNEDPPVFNFSAELNDAFLARLNLLERNYSSRLSTKVDFNFSGNNLDNLQGQILIRDTWYYESGQDVIMDKFALNTHSLGNGGRTLTLRSDYIDADFDGDFNYSQIYPAFHKILRYYLPSLRDDLTLIDADVPEQSFVSVITLKNTQSLSNLFLPGIVINDNVKVESRFNSAEGIVGVYANATDISLFGSRVKNWHFILNARNDELNLKTGASHLLINEADKAEALEIGFENLLLVSNFSGDTISYNITWADQETSGNNAGDLKGFLTFIDSPRLEMRITESDLNINGSPWWFNKDNYVMIDSSSINFNNLVFKSLGQQIRIHGDVSEDPVKKLEIEFEQWNISNFDPILLPYGVNIDGALNGQVNLMELHENPTILANLSIDNFYLNQEKLGNLHLNTSWDPHTKSMWVDSQIKYTGNVGTIIPFSVQGFYYPQGKTGNFDLELQLLNFKLGTMEPFLVDILSDIKGLASGNLSIRGTQSSPEINGSISLMRTEFRVDFSNTYYSLADVIYIEKDRIWADNINIYDQFGNSSTANLLFTHKNFSDFKMDLKIHANNLAGLQTTAYDNSLFYGTAFATGSFSMAGPFSDLKMDINVRSEPQTSISIPISFAVDVTDTDFIIFVNPEGELEEEIVVEEEPTSLNVHIDMEITPDAWIQIYLPYQMGNIRSSGAGNMKMHHNSAGDFTMFGDYEINQGTFLFTLQNMINRTFTLLPGGTIRWSGDPHNADLNIRAVYRTRVTLNSLPNISDEYRNRRFPVECILTLESSLMNPEISFGIRMPNVDEDIQRQVFSAVDTTNEVIMNRQMISLLVLNSFNFSTDQSNLASTLEASTFELLSNQLNSWLSQIGQDFDIGINYRPGDQLSSEELELALSTQLFDDRVMIDGNLGMIGEHGAHRNASNIIGDINVEVKITRDGRFRVKAFNKYNDLEITKREAPYTQGVGVFYRREFDRFGDLFAPRRRIIFENDEANSLSSKYLPENFLQNTSSIQSLP